MLLILCVAWWLILRGDLYKVLSCVASLCFSVILALRLSLGEERAGLCDFCAFVLRM